ncbi:signal recognition particle-docking protein FtsY [Chitinivorax sp. B]|uniref:signal recognition particle-docking protein FtsY n=1 Tax=Chitinivorax sp. B TaxID=2502235 RepID=UPI0010F60808|nr:signal recognition particle-docking protein FtsY [Chitinivorax sp. B]
MQRFFDLFKRDKNKAAAPTPASAPPEQQPAPGPDVTPTTTVSAADQTMSAEQVAPAISEPVPPVVTAPGSVVEPTILTAQVPTTFSTPASDLAPTLGNLETPALLAQPAITIEANIPADDSKPGWLNRLKQGLAKTRTQLGKQFTTLFRGRKIDEDLYEELETILLTGDVGVDATTHLLEDIRTRVAKQNLDDAEQLRNALQQSFTELIQPLEKPLDVSTANPFIIMLAGVNGAGKTTSIGKLAKYYQLQGKKVLLAAGDTFRAAAREQLIAWGERNGVTVIAQESGDSAAVIFDAINAARARGIDIVLADTAGRLPTQLHLMEEIKKVKRVIQKADPTGPHEILLVLDANTGQNALSQVKAFDDALGLTGLVVTKLDGTAKGGVIAAIAKQRPVPVRFIGVGEQIDDLRPFSARDYSEAMFNE